MERRKRERLGKYFNVISFNFIPITFVSLVFAHSIPNFNLGPILNPCKVVNPFHTLTQVTGLYQV